MLKRAGNQAEIDCRFPKNLPNQPFNIDAFVPIGEATGHLLHRFYDQQEQIDGGLMDKFAAYSDARGLAMGFYDEARQSSGSTQSATRWPTISSMPPSAARF